MNEDILNLFPSEIRICLRGIDYEPTEIHIAADKPIILKYADEEFFLKNGFEEAVIASQSDVDFILGNAAEHSMYLKEDEVKQGFITAKGGVRIGVCGSVSYKNGEIIHHGDITSINVRIPKEVRGFGNMAAEIFCSCGEPLNMLIVSPPGKGKTTLLRDVIRVLSDVKGMRVGVVDERLELWGNGAFNLGMRSDVLCGCKKSDGIMMLIRSMAPEVIAVDELGGEEDISAIKEACRCGVRIIATVHGGNVQKELKSSFGILIKLGEKIGEYKVLGGDF